MDEIQNLKESFERDGDWAEWSAWAIIGGLALEVCLLFWFSKDRSSFETLSLVAANGIIAAGVFGEIHFGRRVAKASKRLQQISDEKVTLANQKAQEAASETERLKAEFAWRLLSAAQTSALATELRKSPGSVSIEYFGSDLESWYFAKHFWGVFRSASWHVDLKGGKYADNVDLSFADLSFGLIVPDPEGETAPTTTAIRDALKLAGVEFNTAPLPRLTRVGKGRAPARKGAGIFVGPKPPVMQ